MASSGSGYDLSSSTFSPDGRIFQVEYANKAVEHAGTIMGICCDDGVVMAVQKPKVQKLLVPGFARRLSTVSRNAGMGVTGFQPDARQLVRRAIDESSDYAENYGASIPPSVLSDRIGGYVHHFTLYGAYRPFGAVALIAGYDDERSRYSLHMIEPSGVCFAYKACAAGKGRQPAKTELEKLQLHKTDRGGGGGGAAAGGTKMSCLEAVRQMIRIIHLLHDDNKDKPFELELSWICDATNQRHTGVPKDVIREATEWAKQQLEDDDDDDDDGGGGNNEDDDEGNAGGGGGGAGGMEE